ncbi:8162_t:CDS:2 [Diversispora eburnea]|uniref:8162_t:CDS:1 n=1 Tax=Diversispora eburnea TaxID=1213867 RepID=A0A9N8VIC9_9GLOM|nr:8162_t:CDS:2 [Diversispora eburnea]
MCCGSMWERFIQTSKWSKIFILVSIVQAIITVILETRLLVRNEYLRQDLSHKASNSTAELISLNSSITYHFPEMERAECNASLVDSLTERIERIESENVIFIFFQLFQIWLNLDAIQLIEISIWRRRLMHACTLTSLNLIVYDIPFIIAYMLFATLMIDIFFLLIFAIETWVTYMLNSSDISNQDDSFVPDAIVQYNKVITILIIFSEIIGFVSSRKEWKIGMIIFFVSWLGVIIDFIAILYSSTKFVSSDMGVLLAIITFVWGILVFLNFGKGVKEIITGINHNNDNQNVNFIIDDE